MRELTVIAVLALSSLARTSLGAVVVTPSGTVSGWERLSRDGHLYEAFTGIPYAEPPVGKLRFQPPEPAQKWKGTLNATGDAAPCPQSRLENWSEDCLLLNVYRPKNFKLKKLPVIVRVHGGGFQWGSVGAREAADYIMDEQVVLVTIHYRLNIFGFISFGDKVVPGNYGIKDQVLALRWVNENIAAFGGDPSSITLNGESAGSASTHILLKSPVTKDLVTRAVSDSGTINPVWTLKMADKVKTRAMRIATKLGCQRTTSEAILQCLQQLEATHIVNVVGQDTKAGDPPFVPVIEPKNAKAAVATEDLSLLATNKPWITSVCNGEYLLFLEAVSKNKDVTLPKSVSEFVESWVEDHINHEGGVKESTKALESVYLTPRSDRERISLGLAKMLGDASFIFPVIHDLANHRGPKWVYFFEYVGEAHLFNQSSVPGEVAVAGHAETMLYYYNQRSTLGMNLPPNQTAADYQISKTLISYLVNFAYHDDPTPPGSPFTWSQMKTHEILRITNNGITQGDRRLYRQLENIYNLWNYVIGWPS